MLSDPGPVSSQLGKCTRPGQRMELSCWLCSCCGKFWMEYFLVVQMRRSILFVEVVSLGQCISLSNPEHQNPGIGWGFVPELQLTNTKKSVVWCIQCSDPRKYLVTTQMYIYMYKMYTRWCVNDDRIYIYLYFFVSYSIKCDLSIQKHPNNFWVTVYVCDNTNAV